MSQKAVQSSLTSLFVFFLSVSLSLFIYINSFAHHVYLQTIPVYDSTVFNRLLIALIPGISVCVLLLREKIKINKRGVWILALFVLFITYYSISIVWSPSQGYAGWKTIRVLFVLSAVFLLSSLSCGGEYNYTYTIYYTVLVLSILLSVEVIYSVVYLDQLANIRINTNYIGISRPIGIGILFSMYLYLKKNRYTYLLLIITMFFAMLLTGARGPLIAVTLSFIGYGLWLTPSYRSQLLQKLIWLVPGFAFVGFVGYSLRGHTLRRIQILSDGGGSSLGTRVDMFYSSLEYIAQSPIFGHGIGSFGILYQSDDIRKYPHNIILEIFVEAGVVGTILFITLLSIPYLIAMRSWSSLPILSGLVVSSLTYVILNAMISGDIYANTEVFLFIFVSLFLLNKN